ncbi:MAG: hypothetical protein HY243_13860 [Proteobacteria bacterium]|nr:hypothetical protein [Pseudomonadota bacterium]
MRTKTWAKSAALPLALATGLALSGCGTDRGDRTVSGGLIGAGTGAVIGSLYGHAGTGAIIGGLGGALIGAATNPNMINLGDPPWRHSSRTAYYRHRHNSRVAENSGCTTHETNSERITACPKK